MAKKRKRKNPRRVGLPRKRVDPMLLELALIKRDGLDDAEAVKEMERRYPDIDRGRVNRLLRKLKGPDYLKGYRVILYNRQVKAAERIAERMRRRGQI